jgi:hypothetical protein
VSAAWRLSPLIIGLGFIILGFATQRPFFTALGVAVPLIMDMLRPGRNHEFPAEPSQDQALLELREAFATGLIGLDAFERAVDYELREANGASIHPLW